MPITLKAPPRGADVDERTIFNGYAGGYMQTGLALCWMLNNVNKTDRQLL